MAEPSILGEDGFQAPITWTTPRSAREKARRLGGGQREEIIVNPHHELDWVRDALASGAVLDLVSGLLGAHVAIVEPVFLMAKQPGSGFVVPPHQDGTTERLSLDPRRAVAVWLAVTDATKANGCLEVVPGSHCGGYLPFKREKDANGRGTPLRIAEPPDDANFVPVPLRAGHGVAMDVRLVHRSAANSTTAQRIGLNACYMAPGALTVHHGPWPQLWLSSAAAGGPQIPVEDFTTTRRK